MLPAMAQGVPLNFSLKRVDFLRAAARAACALIAAASLSACAAEPPVQAPIYTAVVNPSLQSLVDKVLDVFGGEIVDQEEDEHSPWED